MGAMAIQEDAILNHALLPGQGGKVRMEWFASENEAKAALVALEVAKRRRGYWLRPEQLPML